MERVVMTRTGTLERPADFNFEPIAVSEPQTEGPPKAVPILTYHSLDNSGSVISIAPREFRDHMKILADRGFTGVALSMLLDAWDGLRPLPARPVVITFDDGFANVLEHAAPCLSDLDFRATIFVVSSRCGQTNDWPQQVNIPHLPLLSWSALGELAAADFEIGAHSVSHRPLTKIPPSEATRQIVESKAAIEEQLSRPVQTFAYPFGIFDAGSRDAVRKYFRAACGTRLASAKPTDDRYCLPRLDAYYLRHRGLIRLFGTVPGELYLRARAVGRWMGRKLSILQISSRHMDELKARRIPGPPARFLVGHIPAFLADKLGFLTRCAGEYGGLLRLNLGGTTILLNEPADIQYVLEANNDNYTKTQRLVSRRGRWLSGHGLLTSYGAAHLTQQRLLQPLFHHRALAPLAESIVGCANATTVGWKNGAEIDVAAEMMVLSQRVIGFALFGVDLLNEAAELSQAIQVRRQFIQYWFSSLFPFPEYLPNRMNRDYRNAIKTIDNTIKRMTSCAERQQGRRATCYPC